MRTDALAVTRAFEQWEVMALVRAGLAAPSGENSQPWKAAVRPDGFDLYFVPHRGASIFDVCHLASRIAAGAFLENVRLAALPMGIVARWQLDPDPSDTRLWARVTLQRAHPREPSLASAIARRHTSRARFDGSPLCVGDAQALSAEVCPPVLLHLVHDGARIARLGRLVGDADRIRAENERAHAELHHWLRWTPAEARDKGDGLDVRTLALGAHERFMMRALMPWSRARVANRIGWSRAAASYGRRLVLSSSAVGVLTAPGATAWHAVATGRVLQRIWLRATLLGLSLSPMTALPFLLLRAELLAGRELSGRHMEDLLRMGALWRDVLALPHGHCALFLFRVGHARPPTIRAQRRPVEDVVSP